MLTIKAPFTEEQIKNLEWWQDSGVFHPYTCPNRDTGHPQREGKDRGQLQPLNDGLWCRDCGYLQTWAHDNSRLEI